MCSSPRPEICQALPIDLLAQAHYRETLVHHGIEDPWAALARAIAASPGWPREASPVLIVRSFPAPYLAVFGSFDASETAWLQAQAHALSPACQRLRYVGYPQIQRDCETLAELLLGRLGAEELRRCRFAAIPRGGLIVLGLLATALGLNRDQLISPSAAHADDTLVLVDDCAVTGARVSHALEGCEARAVVFACLYSPLGLRSALEAQEPRILACLSASDLEGKEFTPEVVAAFPEEPGVRRYWHGMPETLGLPWNEPDRMVWNAASGRYDLAWRIVPPELCLKNRPVAGSPPVPIQVLPTPRGPLQPGASVIYANYQEKIVIADLDAGRSFRLDGSGSEAWQAIVQSGSVEGAADLLGQEYEASQDLLRQDLQRFASELLSQGLLEHRQVD